nr:HSP70 [Pineapple mealybug wilt-associated virus 3]
MEVGIDFGTTYSTLCFSPGKGVDGCVLESGTIYIPTAVGYRTDGSYAIGLGALLEENLTVYRDIKRYFGLNKFNKDSYVSKLKSNVEVVVDDWTCKIGPVDGSKGKTRSVIALASDFVTGLCAIAVRMTGQPITLSVCSVPAAYNSYLRSFIFESCKLSSINVQAVVNEPTAAGLSAFIDVPKSTVNYLLVYDFGGGTFDCSLLVVGASYVCVLDSAGDNYLGGRDIDNRLKEVCVAKLKIDPAQLDSFSMEALKIDLVDKPNKHNRQVLLKSGDIRMVDFGPTEFKSLCEPFVRRARNIVESLLTNRKISKCAAVLIGGSSILPGVSDSIASLPQVSRVLFDRTKYRAAVALGSALYAQTFTGSSRYRLIDAVSASLSDEFRHLRAMCIFPKGHPIPSTVESHFTMPDSDTGVVLMQGESTMANMNEMTFSAPAKIVDFPAKSRVNQQTKISEDGRVEVTLNGKLLMNSVKPRIPARSELGRVFESSEDKRIGPEVESIKSFYASHLREHELSSAAKEVRLSLYAKHGISSD